MFFMIVVNILVCKWVIFCIVTYGYCYLIEVIFDLPIVGQSPCTAHATLRKIIENLLRESSKFPTLAHETERTEALTYTDNRTYEDLLATAILNKAVECCQDSVPSSRAASISIRYPISLKSNIDEEYLFDEEQLEARWKNADLETTSASSLEEWLQSDFSVGSSRYVDRLALTQRIEEISTTDSENNDTEHSENESDILLNADNSNWYLRKRQFYDNHSPVPVPMLVPKPSTETKVLIGEKEAEDTSDLSDALSDYENTELALGVKNLVLESKMLIGGKNAINSLSNGSLSNTKSSLDFGVREDGCELADIEIQRHKTDIRVDDDNIEDVSLRSDDVDSNTEKDTEYTEKYASLPRRILTPTTLPQKSEFETGYYARQGSLPSGAKKTNEVSLPDSIDQVEKSYVYSSLPRSLYSPRNGSTNFVKNPLSSFPESFSLL